MLYVFHGEPKQVIEKVEGTIASLLAKSKDAVVVRVEEGMVERGEVASVLFEQGLFKANYVIYINALSSEVLRGYALENLTLLKESAHIVLLSLGELKEKERNEVEVHAEKVQKCVEKPEVRSEKGEGRSVATGTQGGGKVALAKRDPFAMSDALLAKDTKRLFVELEHARLAGERGGEILGVLFWAGKTMLIAASAKSAGDAGLKDYPYRKALDGLKVWGQGGADRLVFSLAVAQTASYRSGEDIYALLERELCG